MHWQFTPFVLPEIISIAVAAWLAFVFWDNVTWLGTVIAPVAWLAFVLQYTGRLQRLTRSMVLFLAIVPLITLWFAWTNGTHGLITSSLRLDTSASYTTQVVEYGPWFWVNVVYSYLLILLGTLLIVLFIRSLMRSASLYRGQVAALLIATFVPWVASAMTISGFTPLPHVDLTPLAFTITGLAMAWSLFRYRLLDITPVARNAVIEGMSDAVIVMDIHHRITDLNPAAERILGRPLSELVGQTSLQAASAWSDQIERFYDVTAAHEELALTVNGTLQFFDLRISPLTDQLPYWSPGCLARHYRAQAGHGSPGASPGGAGESRAGKCPVVPGR
jgi:PAS domain-containing protein